MSEAAGTATDAQTVAAAKSRTPTKTAAAKTAAHAATAAKAASTHSTASASTAASASVRGVHGNRQNKHTRYGSSANVLKSPHRILLMLR